MPDWCDWLVRHTTCCGLKVGLTPLACIAHMARLCCAHVCMVLLYGLMGELGVAAMSVTEVGAVFGSANADHQRCLLMAAAASQHDALKRI